MTRENAYNVVLAEVQTALMREENNLARAHLEIIKRGDSPVRQKRCRILDMAIAQSRLVEAHLIALYTEGVK